MHTVRRVVIVAALIVAWAIAGGDRTPLSLTMPDAVAAPVKGDDPPAKTPYDLSSLRVLTKVILYVKDNYVDPKRVKPREMMVASLEAVEKSVPDMMVDGTAESGHLRVNVNGKVKEFDIGHVDSLWKMSFTMKDVFDFIAKNMRPVEDTREIEYAAVNGMLQTLDPHSVLLRPELYREMKLTTKGEFGGLGFVIQMKEGVRHRRQVFERIVGKGLVQTRVGAETRRGKQHRVAVGRRFDAQFGGEDRACARAVVDHHRLSPHFRELFRQRARDNVGAAAWSEWRDEAHRT